MNIFALLIAAPNTLTTKQQVFQHTLRSLLINAIVAGLVECIVLSQQQPALSIFSLSVLSVSAVISTFGHSAVQALTLQGASTQDTTQIQTETDVLVHAAETLAMPHVLPGTTLTPPPPTSTGMPDPWAPHDSGGTAV